jgi:uncharacterized membrane protein
MAGKDEPVRLELTFWIAVIGILAGLAALLLVVLVFKDKTNPANTIVAVLGPITTLIGTLGGYVAGQTAGAAGRERAESRADAAQQEATSAQRQLAAVTSTAAQLTNEDVMARAKQNFGEWFTEPGTK